MKEGGLDICLGLWSKSIKPGSDMVARLCDDTQRRLKSLACEVVRGWRK